ncbi:hypothetical protein GS597_18035 [Synechococcales cyanobacterium C]|uniref:Uncharacterized protein n=1 Tax=Petrachloros mirabilis ULC683 TaxID=2781853 RepID=A0A8K2A2F7_9CYAN|nr:hypothetical protein [Petrachloros mirabilis]NCJ08372.1 hypothetical protein [Petrachloros mirabilis ULC683]
MLRPKPSTSIQAMMLASTLAPKQSGFALPLAFGMGLVIMLAAMVAMIRSQDDRATALSQQSTAQAMAVTESGITKMQALLNSNRQLLTYCSRTDDHTACASGQTWQSLTPAQFEVANTCTSSTSSVSSALVTAKDYADDFPNDQWQPIDSANPQKGQFRLVSYAYIPDTGTAPAPPGTGILTVEGRVKPGPDDKPDVGTSISRVAVEFPVIAQTSGVGGPGLWIQSNPDSDASGSVELQTNIQDSTCTSDSAQKKVENFENRQRPIPPDNTTPTYNPTPGVPFPPLPSEGLTPPAADASKGIYHISGGIKNVTQLPQSGEAAVNGVLTYRQGKRKKKEPIMC